MESLYLLYNFLHLIGVHLFFLASLKSQMEILIANFLVAGGNCTVNEQCQFGYWS